MQKFVYVANLPLKSGKLVVLVAWLSFVAVAFGLRRSSCQTAAVWLSKIWDNRKYLWALPTPTTFEKVDQTFIFGTETFSFAVLCYPTENQLNHNLRIKKFFPQIFNIFIGMFNLFWIKSYYSMPLFNIKSAIIHKQK